MRVRLQSQLGWAMRTVCVWPMTAAEHIRVAEPAPPLWEYRAVSTIDTVNARAAEGWRLHTAVPFATHIQYVLERRRP